MKLAPVKKPLTLDAFARSPLIKDLKRVWSRQRPRRPVLLLKSGSGAIAELCARTLQAPLTPVARSVDSEWP
jgi:two-component system nitrogen regulation response regulator NtrX